MAKREQALALAAMLEALLRIRALATTGRCDWAGAEPLLKGIFDLDGETPEQVFAPAETLTAGIAAGLELLQRGFNRPDDLMRLAAQVLALSGRLRRASSAGLRLRELLSQAERQRQAFGLTHDYTVQALAKAYVDGVAPVGARIMISGDVTYLQQERIVAQIRALLLAAMRAAILWRHAGGNSWSFLFRRRHWQNQFKALAASSGQPTRYH